MSTPAQAEFDRIINSNNASSPTTHPEDRSDSSSSHDGSTTLHSSHDDAVARRSPPTMPSATSQHHQTYFLTYQERSQLPHTSVLAAYLLRLIATKKTNLCVSADVTSTSELLQLADEVGDEICMLKTHADIVQDFGHRTMIGLQKIARKRNFLINILLKSKSCLY